jgi:hypothetical protein
MSPFSRPMLIEAKRRWLNPPLSTAPFWRDEKLIRPYPVDRRLVEELALLYSGMKYELLEWPLETYHAIDLFAYLDSLPPEKAGRGNYLTVTNSATKNYSSTGGKSSPTSRSSSSASTTKRISSVSAFSTRRSENTVGKAAPNRR